MATCKECLHGDVCETFCGGIPRMQRFGDRADRDCGHFERRITIDGREIANKHVQVIVKSSCKELNIFPNALAKWRPCQVLYLSGKTVADGYMCTRCGSRSAAIKDSCDACGAAMHGIDTDIHISTGDKNDG